MPPPNAKVTPEDPIKISLHDCLACSGCVTTAETVLLQHQSISEFASRLENDAITVVVSLSPQSVVSLAAVYGLQPGECAGKIAAVLKARNVKAVFDISWARDIALIETAEEFIQRYYKERLGLHSTDEAMDVEGQQDPSPLPMLASACPGWVCYAEKTHGDYVLPYISTAKSPQAVMGTLVKHQWAPARGLDPARVYHCAVMPCYDKKLEAAREDFLLPGQDIAIPETDSVLATTELYDWLQQQGIDLKSTIPLVPFDPPFTNQIGGLEGTKTYGLPGGSGGYMEYVYRTAARVLFGRELLPGPLNMTQGRNPDIKECILEGGDGQKPLKFACAYGFRNIQGLMRKIKTRRCEYDYVEVMACPSGCLNGGGQMKPRQGQTVQQLIEELENDYHGEDYLVHRQPHENPSVQALYSQWIGDGPATERSRQLLHTGYHKREKTVTAAIADW